MLDGANQLSPCTAVRKCELCEKHDDAATPGKSEAANRFRRVDLV